MDISCGGNGIVEELMQPKGQQYCLIRLTKPVCSIYYKAAATVWLAGGILASASYLAYANSNVSIMFMNPACQNCQKRVTCSSL